MYAELERKTCKQCTKNKPITEFRKRKRKTKLGIKEYYESYCKACEAINNKEWMAEHKEERQVVDFCRNLKRKFNMTKEQYYIMLTSQNGGCAICTKPKSESGKALAVDHCHDTLKIRGLLCNECNTAIGLFFDRVDLLEAAIKYLLKFKK